jgi:hypothetical protein
MSLGDGIRTARTVDIAKMMKTAGYDFRRTRHRHFTDRPRAVHAAFDGDTSAPPASGCFSICDREGEIDGKAYRQDSLHHGCR